MTHRPVFDDVLHYWHSSIILLDQDESVDLPHTPLSMDHRRAGFSYRCNTRGLYGMKAAYWLDGDSCVR